MTQGNELHDHFSKSATKPPVNTLYHCVNQPLRGDALLPTCERVVNGKEDKYLFAASHLSKAMAFAFDFNKDPPDIICNGPISDTNDEFAVICEREKTLQKMPTVHVYSFSPENFHEVRPGQDTRQFVSREPLPLAKAELVLKTNNVEDLMRNGLQIFSAEKNFHELGGSAFLDMSNASSAEERLIQLLQSGKLRWENQERKINPSPKLLQIQTAYRQKTLMPSGPKS